MSDIANLYIRVDSKGVVTASKDLAGLEQAAAKVEGTTKKVESATASANRSFMQMASVVKALAVSYGALKLSQYIKDATMLAARYETLGVVMRVVGNNAGYTGAQMETFARGLEKTGISMIEARQTLTRMVQANLDLTQSLKLARVAQDAAVIGNINSSEAFQRMVYGIQSGQVEILRTIGINVNFENSYQKVAKATGRVTAQLSEAEKSQIRMNVVMDAGKMIAGTYEAAMGTAGKQILSMQRHLDNLKVAFGLAFTPALAEIIENITGAVTDLNGELSGNSKEKIAEWGVKFRMVLIDIEAEIRRLAMFLDKLGGTMTSAQMLLYGPGRALGFESSTKRFEEAADANMEYEQRYNASDKALEDLMAKRIKLEESLTAEGKKAAKAAADAAEAKVLAARKATTATEKAVIADEKAIAAAQKLREEWKRMAEDLNFEKATAGMDDLDKKLAEIERDMAKMRENPNADLKLIDDVGLQRQTAAIKKWYDEYLQEQIKAKENFDRYEKAKQDSIAKGAQETAEEIKKQYDADGQLLRDKLELYKDLTGFEDEYRQVQLDWIERIKKEEIAATGDVVAAEKKAAEARADIEYNLFKTKTDYIATGFSQLQSAFTDIAETYDEGSSAAKRWEEAANAMEIAQKGVAVVQAVAAIATQGLGDPYTAFARIAAMAATMGALLATIGASLGGFGGSAPTSAPQYTFSTSVLGGDTGEKSESLEKSWELLEETYDMEYEKLTKIYNELKDLNGNITGLVTSIIRTGSVGANFTIPGYYPGGAESFVQGIAGNIPYLSGLVGSLFGGGTEYWSGNSGISIYGGTARGFSQGAETGGHTFLDMYRKKEGGWFHSDEYSQWRQTQPLDASVVDLLSKVYQSLTDTLVELTIGLGQDITKTLDYVFPGGELVLNGLNADQINEAVTNYFSEQADAAVQALFGYFLRGYQEVGESLTDTAVRLMVDKEIVLEVLAQTNQAYSGTVEGAIALSESLVKLAGDLETLSDITATYYDKFFTEEEKHLRLQEQLTTILGSLNIALPATRQAYRDTVESIDLLTTSGQEAYITLLKLAKNADIYYSTLEDMADDLVSAVELAAQAVKDAIDATNTAISEQISLSSAAASAARSAADEYRNIIKSLTDAQESIRGGSAAELQQRFDSLFATAMTGDREALSALPGAADKLLAGSLASSQTALDYARDQGKMLLALEEAKTVSGVSANWQDYQATLLETQVNVLEQIRDELQQESPDLALLEQHAGLLEDIATLLGGQTSEIITGNATQDVIANLSGLDASYSAEMLNALVSREVSQESNLENILKANTTAVSLLRQLVDLTTASNMEKALAEIKSAYETIQSASTRLQAEMATYTTASQMLATAQNAVNQTPLTLAAALAKNAGTPYSTADAPAQYGTYTLSSGRMSKDQLITNLFNAGLGSVITQKESSYIATNYNDLWESYGHYYLDENGILRSAPGGNYHADLGQGWSQGGATSTAYITADVQGAISAKQSAVASALAATQQAVKDVDAANQRLSAAQSEYSALVAQYESTFGSAPAFASGGPFSGGLRIVGEGGPELEYTGPSHIVNASKTEAFMNSNEALLAEIKKLNAKVERLEAISYQTTKNTQKTAKTLEKFDYDGLPAERAA